MGDLVYVFIFVSEVVHVYTCLHVLREVIFLNLSSFTHVHASLSLCAHIHAHIPCLSTLCSETVSVNLELTDRAVSPVWAALRQSLF